MKISVYSILMLLLAAQLLVAATTGAQDIRQTSVTIGFTNATLKDALQSLQKKSGYSIFYLSQPVSRYRDISLPTENRSVHKTLELLLDRTTITFKQEGSSIVLTEQEAAIPPVKSRPPVKGKVTDRAGQGLPGVTVLLKGSSKGTTTDQSGNYSLEVPSETATLVFSFVGYLSQEVSVGNKNDIDVLLAPDERALDEIVVVGYGSKTKREVTGAISSVQSKAISEQAVTGFDQAMAGRVAGVQIVQNSASPGGNTSIRVRGVGTPGVSEPLYVIDGVPVFDSSVPSMINPNDIESIEVLKDAASGAIYGARGANGVVLISTKQGKKGPAKVSLNYYYGVQSFQKRFDMLGADDYKNFLRARNTPFTDSNANVDWFREITGPAPIQNANLSLQGGSESTNYFVSADYIDQKGIIKNTDFKRFTTRFNLQSKINSRLRVGTNLTVGKSWRRTRSENSIWSLLGTALYYPPIVPVREAGGQYGDATEYVAILNSNNPLAQAEVGSYKNSQLSMLGNLFAEYEPVKGLSYKLNLGVNYKGDVSDSYFPGYTFGVKARTDGNPNVGKGINNQTVWLIENTLTYKLELNNTHRFTLLAGATQQESNGESLYGQRLNAVSKDPTLISINSSPAVLQRASGGFDSWSIASFLGRFDYSYKGKYLLTASVRRDGSSKFAPGRRWGTFPSVSAGWVISDEKFFNVKFISDLKLRASWGQLGNQEIAAFQYLSTLGTVSYLFGNNTVAGVYPNNVANQRITWETSKQTDIGLDMTLFNNKVTVGIDYFDKRTDGILLTDPITSVYGYTDAGGGVINSTKNAGLIANRGLEFSLGYQHRQGAFRWSANANAATLQNEVLSLGGGAPLINSMNLGLYTTRTDVGGQIGAFYGKVVERVGEDGHFVFVKGPNGQDLQTNIGNPIPSLTYGFNANADYRNFDFSMAWQGVAGNDIYAATLFQTGNFSYSTNNLIKRIYDQAGTTAPAVAVANGADYAGSSWFVYDGSFLRLRSLQIGYTIPATPLKRIGLDRVRLYVTGQNLLTFDKYYVGLNPEVGAFNQNNVAAGMDQGAYPTPITVTTGLNVTF